jgi:hypothetical protein
MPAEQDKGTILDDSKHSFLPWNLKARLVRLYGTTAVLMGRLQSKSDSKQVLNGTFVYIRQEGGWRLVSLHLSPQK